MKAREIWELSPEQIQGRLEDAHAELFNLRFQFSIGQMRNNARLREVRKDIARLNTILRAKQLEWMKEQGAR
jgi:large subunit ribosomal protein L29